MLPIQLLDPFATRASGFVSSSVLSEGKATRRGVVVDVPLKEWSIGAVIPAHGMTSEPLFNLVWEQEALKVRDTSGSTLFELQVKKGCLEALRYVDVKVSYYLSSGISFWNPFLQKTSISEPIIQIRPSASATVQNHTTYRFNPGTCFSLQTMLT